MDTRKRTAILTILAAIALTVGASGPAAGERFKITNIHFEANASACDMGIQVSFDTAGVTLGSVTDPHGRTVFLFDSAEGMGVTHDITEGFQERVEPQLIELREALGCERDEEEPEISLDELLAAWPSGRYIFRAANEEASFAGGARLSHKVAAGPEILTPEDGDVVPLDEDLVIEWTPVSEPLIPELGPVRVVGYHVLIADVTRPLRPGHTKIQFDADVPGWASSMLVGREFLRGGRIYELEILATERGGNQTITEGGVFCTPPIAPGDCEAP